MKHTPEPWEAYKAGPTQRVTISTQARDRHGRRERSIAAMADYRGPEEANAARIVSCVNALAGLNPEGVRACVEALEFLLAWIKAEKPVVSDLGLDALDAARAALEKVKQ